jgi:3-methyl-2-oxobutanoate hydroxymethyltransferase
MKGIAMRLTLHDLRRLAGERKLATLTCYDASFAAVLDAAEVDMLLVGDSLGMVIQGHDSTLPVMLEDVAYHTRAVLRGARRPWIVSDLPFGSYQQGPEQAFASAVVLMQAGAQMVKLEGGTEMAATVRFLVERGIPVCAHVGLTPQHVNNFGGYKVQGRGGGAERVQEAAFALEGAGAAMIVIEAVPESVGRAIALKSTALTIGIGASVYCHGQVLVLHDMLGIGVGRRPRFVKNFLDGTAAAGTATVAAAVRRYVAEVRSGQFPGADHVYPDDV